jgi:uncharacterized protein YjbJ (UPF0337 family)
MNRDIAMGRWRQLKAQMKSKWAKLTGQETSLETKADAVGGKIQEKYGIVREKVEDVKQTADELVAKAPSGKVQEAYGAAREKVEQVEQKADDVIGKMPNRPEPPPAESRRN